MTLVDALASVSALRCSTASLRRGRVRLALTAREARLAVSPHHTTGTKGKKKKKKKEEREEIASSPHAVNPRRTATTTRGR